jgi:signal transduction histidine kinase
MGDIIVSLKRKGDRAVFSCKDNGIGIPIDEQKNIFKKFYRASNTLGVGSPGSGIGLYICKVYVEEMNGKIWFKSKGENKGTTFFVSLPLV